MIHFQGIEFIDAPEAHQVIDEVCVNDCYRVAEIPDESVVVDVGSFYGEFALLCASKRRCHVFAFEPNPISFAILTQNMVLNKDISGLVALHNMGVGGSFCEALEFHHWPLHPGGSGFRSIDGGKKFNVQVQSIADVVTVARLKSKHVTVKLDCEGSEVEIFKNNNWLSRVKIVAMEWHNNDGCYFRDVLASNGFKVDIRDECDCSGGILFAKR